MKSTASLVILLSLGLAVCPPTSFAADRDAKRVEKFEALNGTGDPSQPLQTTVGLGTALSALAQVTTAFDQSGTGDVEYWMKTARDYGRAAQALGGALSRLGSSMEPGPVAAAVAGMGGQLVSVSYAGHGDVHYWMARVKSICATVRGVGQQMNTMAASCGANGPTVRGGAVLQGLAIVAESVDCGGNGDVEYWMKTTRSFCQIGHGVGRGVDLVAGSVPAPLDGVLRGLGAQFGGLSSAGTGSVQYWMARARGVSEQMSGLSNSLNQIASSL